MADATISVWPMHPNGRMAFEGEPLQRLHTASDGTVDAVFACDVRAVAAKNLGASTVAWLNAAKDAGNQTVLVLQPTVLQRGTVLRSDGTPAVGATVRINVQGFNSLQRGMAPEPAALQTDADGRFAVRLQKFAPYAIDAVLDGKPTFRDGFEIRTDDPPDLLLTFPGAITVRGIVVDPDGRPVANARVSCWREYHLEDPGLDPDDMETCSDQCGTDGSFALELRQYRRYQLIASAPGFANSAVLWIEPTVVHAHAEVRLPLLLPASIHGIVLHDDGSPFAGVSVMATPEAGTASRANAVPSREAMFGRSLAGRTDAEGRFAFAVHPGTQWKLQVWPVRGSRAICYARPHVAADGTEVEWRISDAQLAGCRVRGTVMRADDGLPVARFGVRLVALDDADADAEAALPSEQTGGQFELCLPLGRRCAIEILPGPGASPGASWPDHPELAPVRTEPFTTTSLERQFAVRVPDWATVPLRILSAEGEPAHDVRATVQTNGVFRPRKVTRTDRDGRLVLDHCVPGTAMLTLWRGMTKVGEQQVVLTPGLNPELGVLLVATMAPR